MAFIPTICGNKSNITLPTGSCSGITFEGVEDTTVNQGEGIDLMDGVTAYDEDGNEIPVTVSPTEIAKCDVGEHTVEYKAIGKGGNLKPYLPCSKGKLTVADCGISVETTERVITITQADPPTISGVETLTISVGTLVDLMDGVSAVDDNGNTVEVEFLGGAVDDVAESDDIASFETDLDVPLKSLELTLEPQQPCTPWIGTAHDTTPYLNRAMPTQSNDYNRESGVIVGGTVGWNQLCNGSSVTVPSGRKYIAKISGTWSIGASTGTAITGLTAMSDMIIDLTAMFGSTIADYIYSLEQATAGAGVAWFRKYFPEDYYPYSANTLQSVQATAHKTYDGDGNVLGNYALDSSLTLRGIPKLDASNNLYYDGDTYESDGTVTRNTIYRAYQSGDESLANAITDGTNTVVYSANASTETATAYTNPQVVDDGGTEEYVTANYVPVGHDSTYSLVCPISGYDSVSANVTGVNQWDEQSEKGSYNITTGVKQTDNNNLRCVNPIPVMPNTTYYFRQTTATSNALLFYDADGNYISYLSRTGNNTFTTPENAHYMTFYLSAGYGTTYNNDISINYPSTDTDYHSGTNNATHTSQLPETVYGGMVDLVSGEVTIDRAMVDLGSLNWTKYDTTNGNWRFGVTVPTIALSSGTGNLKCTHYATISNSATYLGKIGISDNGTLSHTVFVCDMSYTDATTFKSAMSGVQLVYELATPRTLQLTPQEIRTLLGTNNVWSEDATHVRVIFTKSMTEDTQFNVEGLFSANYRAEDECGNETIITRLINVGGVQAEALENENGIALQTEDSEVLIYVAPTEPVNNLVGSAYVGISEAQ